MATIGSIGLFCPPVVSTRSSVFPRSHSKTLNMFRDIVSCFDERWCLAGYAAATYTPCVVHWRRPFWDLWLFLLGVQFLVEFLIKK